MKKIAAMLALSTLVGCTYEKSQYVLDVENAPAPASAEAKAIECAHLFSEIDRNNALLAQSYQDGSYSMSAQNEKDARNEALSIRTFKISCPRR
ncbi:hypothetical protein [Pseudomonas sessilinigenes]|uniref:Lipoprotein n=1 Tax=Pseudomonas sessilinigenes TaxID=658629 RepID=A0ABX8MJ56_9PSED|nr:hypothetical protein [Pseudomonas sessilinigenes]QXH38742.1 hypothetical protein KSS89_21060 [Pseudomonas sessilinigenes]